MTLAILLLTILGLVLGYSYFSFNRYKSDKQNVVLWSGQVEECTIKLINGLGGYILENDQKTMVELLEINKDDISEIVNKFGRESLAGKYNQVIAGIENLRKEISPSSGVGNAGATRPSLESLKSAASELGAEIRKERFIKRLFRNPF